MMIFFVRTNSTVKFPENSHVAPPGGVKSIPNGRGHLRRSVTNDQVPPRSMTGWSLAFLALFDEVCLDVCAP